MPTRRRADFMSPVVVGGGDGGAAPTVRVGPDYGERPGSDGLTNEMGVQVRMPGLALASEDEIGIKASMPLVALASEDQIGVHLSGSVLGSPFYPGIPTTNWLAAATATTITPIACNKPAGTVEGSFLIMRVGALSAISTNTPAFAIPAGWIDINFQGVTGGLGGRTFYKFAGPAEPASYSCNITAVGGLKSATIEIHRLTAVDTINPIDAELGGQNAAIADPIVNGIDTTVINCLVFAFLTHDHGAANQTHTQTAGQQERTDFNDTTATRIGSCSSTRVYAAVGATGTVTFNCTEVVASAAVYHRVAIRPTALVLAA